MSDMMNDFDDMQDDFIYDIEMYMYFDHSASMSHSVGEMIGDMEVFCDILCALLEEKMARARMWTGSASVLPYSETSAIPTDRHWCGRNSSIRQSTMPGRMASRPKVAVMKQSVHRRHWLWPCAPNGPPAENRW